MFPLLLSMLIGYAASAAVKMNLPPLNTIQEFRFQYPYSCRPSSSSSPYDGSGLFLSDKTIASNDPDLLYNGACGAKDYFQATVGGISFAVIADLGDVPLENVTSSRAFNYLRTVGMDNIFRETSPVVIGHTYAVLSTRQQTHSLFAIQVVDYQKNGPMQIRYAVREYSVIETVQTSPGFSWEEPNH